MIVSARHKLIKTLREQAERAAQASVHHAALSQHYLDVSQRLAALADQSDEFDVDELERQLVSEANHADASTQLQETLILNQTLRTVPEDGSVSAASPASREKKKQRRIDHETHEPPANHGVSAAQQAARGHADGSGPIDRLCRPGIPQLTTRADSAMVRETPRLLDIRQHASSLFTSITLLSAILILLSLWRWQIKVPLPPPVIDCSFTSAAAPLAPIAEVLPEQPEIITVPDPVELIQEIPEELTETVEQDQLPEPAAMRHVADAAPPKASGNGHPLPSPAALSAVAIDDPRSPALRQLLLQEYGGSPESEKAVQRALAWLISVQHPRGYWDFPRVGAAGNAGTVNNPIGGTAYALLPFLSAGHTHRDGDYQQQVGRALTWLTQIGIRTPAGFDLRGVINKQSKDREPNEAYYVHGAATLALCEAYGMTKDARLRPAASEAIRFLINSQDPQGGGWRYVPQEAGSTSVTAIQVMAISAARRAGIEIPDAVYAGIRHYLNSVQVDRAGKYGYEVQKKRYTGAVTSMALLCRLYLGSGRSDEDLCAGVELLDRAGPYDNLYSLYFSTQVMKHWGGEKWNRWNSRMRDDLIAAQEKSGPGTGSWGPRTRAIHAKQGGRLLTTVLATLTLEVYYRYKPMLPPEETLVLKHQASK